MESVARAQLPLVTTCPLPTTRIMASLQWTQLWLLLYNHCHSQCDYAIATMVGPIFFSYYECIQCTTSHCSKVLLFSIQDLPPSKIPCYLQCVVYVCRSDAYFLQCTCICKVMCMFSCHRMDVPHSCGCHQGAVSIVCKFYWIRVRRSTNKTRWRLFN